MLQHSLNHPSGGLENAARPLLVPPVKGFDLGMQDNRQETHLSISAR